MGRRPTSTSYKGVFQHYRDKILDLKLPTPYESPVWFPVLAEMVSSIRAGVVANDLPGMLPPPLIFGTLPTGDINAQAVLLPRADYYLVLFDSGLFPFAFAMAKLVARLLPPAQVSEDDMTIGIVGDPDPLLDQDPKIVEHFESVLQAYVVDGNPRPAAPFDLPLPFVPMAIVLLRTMELFVLGHELGHLIARHLVNRRVRTTSGQVSAEKIQFNWDQEYEADNWGLNYVGITESSLALKLSYSGCDLFFSCIRVVERCLNVLQQGLDEEDRPWIRDTHPPVMERRQRLRTIIEEDAPPDQARECLEFSQSLQGIVEALWQRVRLSFNKMHAKGVRPSVAWLS